MPLVDFVSARLEASFSEAISSRRRFARNFFPWWVGTRPASSRTRPSGETSQKFLSVIFLFATKTARIVPYRVDAPFSKQGGPVSKLARCAPT
jgi:hypothetical protein